MQMRKLAGLAMGALFVGSTLAAAATLGDFPAPFVQNGQVTGLVVVGANAQPADVVAAINLAARLGSEATVERSVTVPSVSSADVTGGMWLQKKGKVLSVTEDLTGGGYSTLTSRYLPDLLADGSVREKDGTEVDYVQKLEVTNGATINYDDAAGDFTSPRLYVDMPQGTTVLTYELDFLGTFNVSNRASNAKMTLLGREFTIGPSDANTLTLFGGGNEVSLQAGGDPVEVTVGGETHTFRMLSWTVDGNGNVQGATLEIDGQVDTYDKGSYYTIPGSTQKFYLDDVVVEKTPSTSGGAGETARAKLFVGSNKIEIPVSTSSTTQTVRVNDQTFRDAKAVVVKDSNGNYKKIKVEWALNDNERVMEGETWTDPLFGAVGVHFAGLGVPFKDSSRDVVSLSKASTTSATLRFTNTYGTEYDLKLDNLDGSTAAAWKVGSKTVHHNTTYTDASDTDTFPDTVGSGDLVNVNDYVLLSKSTATTEGSTYLLQLTDIDTTKKVVTFVDAKTGREYKATYSTPLGDNNTNLNDGFTYDNSTTNDLTGITWDVLTLGDEFRFRVVTDGTNNAVIFLNDGALAVANSGPDTHEAKAFTRGGTAVDLDVTLSSGTYSFTATKALNPSVDGMTDETYTFEVTTQSGEINNVDVKWTAATPAMGSYPSGYKVGDTNEYRWVSRFGTYAEYDTDADTADLYVPTDAVEARVALGSPDMQVTSTSTEGGVVTYREAQPVTAEIAMLDTEAEAYKTTSDLILVGGTTVNSLVRELAESGKLPEVWDGSAWTLNPGEAIIKMVNDAWATGHVALVVAGTDAEDTAAAVRVLQQYDQYSSELSGKEVVKVVKGVVTDVA